MSRLRTYLATLMALALGFAALTTPAQARAACCCVQAIVTCVCCPGAAPSQNDPSACASCEISCRPASYQNASSLIGAPSAPRILGLTTTLLPEPPRARPRPPRRSIALPPELWALPSTPPVASLNIDLPPPSTAL